MYSHRFTADCLWSIRTSGSFSHFLRSFLTHSPFVNLVPAYGEILSYIPCPIASDGTMIKVFLFIVAIIPRAANDFPVQTSERMRLVFVLCFILSVISLIVFACHLESVAKIGLSDHSKKWLTSST